jgi:hypothetical protein
MYVSILGRLERDVLGLMNLFAAVCPIIDQLLEERIAPVRQRR